MTDKGYKIPLDIIPQLSFRDQKTRRTSNGGILTALQHVDLKIAVDISGTAVHMKEGRLLFFSFSLTSEVNRDKNQGVGKKIRPQD